MRALIRGQSRESISTAVMGTVLECHELGSRFLGGMAPDANAVGSQFYVQTGSPVAYWMSGPGLNVDVAVGRSATSLSVPVLSVGDDEVSVGPVAEPAVRHLRALMAVGRDGKLAYLSGAGMGKAEVARLVSLVVGWVDEAGLERLNDWSRLAARRELGPGHVLERWINGRCQLLLALLLDDASFGDPDLVVAYALSHAADLVLASYWSDLGAEDDVIALAPGDDFD